MYCINSAFRHFLGEVLVLAQLSDSTLDSTYPKPAWDGEVLASLGQLGILPLPSTEITRAYTPLQPRQTIYRAEPQLSGTLSAVNTARPQSPYGWSGCCVSCSHHLMPSCNAELLPHLLLLYAHMCSTFPFLFRGLIYRCRWDLDCSNMTKANLF